VAGDDNGILVTNAKLGAALAAALGNSSVVLMRGHGIAVVAASVRDVVFRGVYTQEDAQIEAEALRLGQPIFLNAMEAARVDAANQATMLKAWDLWDAQARAHALPSPKP
jgi:HCOMODA/2-hydroxy-3-carboxy-muconic semialdehyde decarboxylase